MQHDLTVVDTDVKTPLLDGGESATLDLSSLAAGSYEVICSVPGHEASGMRATLVIGDGTTGGSGHVGHGTGDAVDWEAMDEMMRERTESFPVATEGVGAVDLEPTIAEDGAKVFELTASEFDWEVEPGKVVQAMGYNEMVPGPTIRAEVGDRVRIVLHNEMGQSTALHSHGFVLPNAMDGVPDITQEPIPPGESFTYEFVATHAMVGMYHSHHNAHIQVTNGMLGAFYVGDMPLPAEVASAGLAQDIPMILNDAGTIGLSLNGKSFPATAPIVANVGDWIKIDYMNEGLQVHPMHLHGMPQLVIAKDGYPLATPSMEDTVTVAPGERVSVLVHVTEPGVWAWHCHILNHAEGDQGMFGMVTALIAE
ncbi:MAG TPA: multicopper oxidase domain-containing protein, partial [Acidimicrobiales bacterium]|nr:multicopper oxidase domain-containing protein [Acidimicrobiales bacterium]